MNNVVQNINIENILPSRFPPNQEELQKIDELVQIIKTFGLLDPLLVRPKDGKYEIVMGIDKFEAAKKAGLSSIPVMIKEIDDRNFYQYLKMTNHTPNLGTDKKVKKQNNNLSNVTIPLENQNNDNSLQTPKWISGQKDEYSDIINLSELSKIEYERDDRKMNNDQLNNAMMNNNIGREQVNGNQSSKIPTFGGRFFPSLEDEPTNMNMMPDNNPAPVTMPENQMINNPMPNNNLIDLTDLTTDNDVNNSQPNEFINQQINQPVPNMNQPVNNIPTPDFAIPTPEQSNMMPPIDNIINLESLQQNNQVIQPTPELSPLPTMSPDFNQAAPVPPQFDMSQNMAPQMQMTQDFNQQMNGMMPDFAMPTPEQPLAMPQVEIPQVEIPQLNEQPNQFMASEPITNMNNNLEQMAPINQQELQQPSLKDVSPVTNTIKNLVSSLEMFGYQINISEEDLPTTSKITIEIQK